MPQLLSRRLMWQLTNVGCSIDRCEKLELPTLYPPHLQPPRPTPRAPHQQHQINVSKLQINYEYRVLSLCICTARTRVDDVVNMLCHLKVLYLLSRQGWRGVCVVPPLKVPHQLFHPADYTSSSNNDARGRPAFSPNADKTQSYSTHCQARSLLCESP